MALLRVAARRERIRTRYTIVKWAGSLYLIFLALRIVRDRSTSALPPRDCDKKTYHNVYRDGVLVNVLNPKVSLLMLAIVPQFVHVTHGNVTAQIATLGTLYVMIAGCVLVLIVAAATRTAGLLKRRPIAETMLRWGTATLLFGLGARMAVARMP